MSAVFLGFVTLANKSDKDWRQILAATAAAHTEYDHEQCHTERGDVDGQSLVALVIRSEGSTSQAASVHKEGK